MNGKGLAQMEMMFHEIAGTLERCERYAGTFQKPIDGQRLAGPSRPAPATTA